MEKKKKGERLRLHVLITDSESNRIFLNTEMASMMLTEKFVNIIIDNLFFPVQKFHHDYFDSNNSK